MMSNEEVHKLFDKGFLCQFIGWLFLWATFINSIIALIGTISFFCLSIPFYYEGYKQKQALKKLGLWKPKTWKEILRLKRDKRGVFYIWVAVAIFIASIIILWFPLSWVCYQVIDMCTASFAYPPEAQGAIVLLKNVVAWFVVVAVGGFILWAYVASQRRDPYTEMAY